MERLASLTIDDFLARLGSKEPVPGGGAAAAVTGAIGAALAQMVVTYSIGRKNLPAQAELIAIEAELRGLRDDLTAGADADARAYAGLSALWKLPKDDPQRTRNWPGALASALGAPSSVMACGLRLLTLCEKLAPIGNTNLLSDLAGAAALAEACVLAAGQNVRVNAALLDDKAAAEEVLTKLERDRLRASELRAAVERACGS